MLADDRDVGAVMVHDHDITDARRIGSGVGSSDANTGNDVLARIVELDIRDAVDIVDTGEGGVVHGELRWTLRPRRGRVAARRHGSGEARDEIVKVHENPLELTGLSKCDDLLCLSGAQRGRDGVDEVLPSRLGIGDIDGDDISGLQRGHRDAGECDRLGGAQ